MSQLSRAVDVPSSQVPVISDSTPGPTVSEAPADAGLVRQAQRRSELFGHRVAARAKRVFWLGVSAGAVCMSFGLILTVLASLAGPPSLYRTRSNAALETRTLLKRYVFEAYPLWSRAYPDRDCPRSLHELSRYLTPRIPVDAWGAPIELRCGTNAPFGVRRLWVRSAGEDRVFDTSDDLVDFF